jgi:hypothetical protein
MSDRLVAIKKHGPHHRVGDAEWLIDEVERLEKECIRWQARAEAAEHNFKSTLDLLAKAGRG